LWSSCRSRASRSRRSERCSGSTRCRGSTNPEFCGHRANTSRVPRAHTGRAFAPCGRPSAAPQDVLRRLERVRLDDRGMRVTVGPHSLAVMLPAHLRLASECDVLDVEENLPEASPVPGLAPGVPGIPENRPHRRLGPLRQPCPGGSGPGRGHVQRVIGQHRGSGLRRSRTRAEPRDRGGRLGDATHFTESATDH
jgi:hypothetical protein